MAKRTHQSVDPAPVIEAISEPAVESLMPDPVVVESAADAPVVDAAGPIAVPASDRGVATLTEDECRAELDRLGDPVAHRKEVRRALEALIAGRDQAIKELDARILAADRNYRAVMDQTQADAERVRLIMSVRLPALGSAVAAAAASQSAAIAQAESTAEREALL